VTHTTFSVEHRHLFWVTLSSDITHVLLKVCFISNSQQQRATQCHPDLLLQQYFIKTPLHSKAAKCQYTGTVYSSIEMQ